MKKTLVYLSLIFCVVMIFNTNNIVLAENTNIIDKDTESRLVEIKENTKKELQDYEKAYGDKSYGLAAYILNKVRIYSIPCCFIGIAVGAIYQYVIGIRKLDTRDKGFGLVIGFVTIFVICQVLPLVFAIVVKGWRG